MRGADVMQEGLFSFKRLGEFVPLDHPLRGIRAILNAALARLDAKFDDMYALTGRDSIAPEKLLRALMLQALYGIRSERALCDSEPVPIQRTPRSTKSVVPGRSVRSLATNQKPAGGGQRGATS